MKKAALLCGDAAFFHTFLFFMNVAVNSLYLRMSCFDDAIE